MLSSLSLGSIDNLEKLPINSLNSICERVRQALLHVFLPRLCEKCRPTFSEAFRKTQSTPLLLKALCEPCKINYVKDKRSVSRKKLSPSKVIEATDTTQNTEDNENINTTKLPAKKKQKMEVSRNSEESSNSNNNNQNNNNNISNFGKLKVKIKLISATSKIYNNNNNPISHPLPLTPPPTDDSEDIFTCKSKTKTLTESEANDNVTIFIDNSEFKTTIKGPQKEQIYEYFNEKGIDWCRYCGVAGETGTFWKLGPWGDRTLCHKHGCEFFGCGFARVTKTRLDLTEFYNEKRSDRIRPIISEYCSSCWGKLDDDDLSNTTVSCNGCPLAFHKTCYNNFSSPLLDIHPFYCTESCHENFEKCLIRPQFSSKSSFPFYRQLLTLPASDNTENTDNNVKVRLQITKKAPEVKKRKYNHRKQNENQVDRVIAFLPIKVDQTVHLHETIKTPQWTKKSLQDRLNQPITTDDQNYKVEVLDDQFLLDRHARYEHVEKTTRLLKPGVLEQLISGEI